MKNIIKIFFILIFTLFTTCVVFGLDWVNLKLEYDGKIHTYSAEKINIYIDNEHIKNFKMEPIILNGRTLVPLRDVFEKIDAKIQWNDEKREVTIQKNENTVVFKIDSNKALKNGTETITFDVPAKIINDYTMVPLRAISNSLGYEVNWDNNTRTVFIKTDTQDTTKQTETTTEATTENTNTQGGLTILWDQTAKATNDSAIKRQPIEGLDVLCPTWFAIKNSNGDVEDNGSIDYANWAKQQGYQLWGLVSNSFDKNITHDTLSVPEKRTKIINQLLDYAKKYNLQGINIDFESVAKEDGAYYLQFIKEATPIFKQNGLVVSVDMYVPTPWTAHYQMEEVGKIVDYVIIMAYDEHYSTSKESGSVSSLPWAEKYMTDATKLVDKNKLIMGIPFYTRVWTETKNADGTVSVVSKSLKMDEATTLLKNNNAKIIFDEKTGQNYGEYFSDGTTKKIWLEDAQSIKSRMEVAKKLGVKGVAAWKRGHETEGIWQVINSYF